MILKILIKRNVKLFFKDKGLFFTSLITPLILLVLYATFLGNVYTDSLRSTLPSGFTLSDDMLKGFAGSQLLSSLLSVSCITVAFCSNMLMVQDKANGSIRDFTVSPVRPSIMALAYYVATLISTFIVCFVAMFVGLLYVAMVGWYFTIADILLLALDVILLCLFGVALSSLINFFLSSQGQISAIGSIVSSCYGFLSGAYMPLSQFAEGLRTVIMFLPGTYGTSLVRNHAMRGVLAAMEDDGLPSEFITGVKDAFDVNLYLFDTQISLPVMYAVVLVTIALLVGAYVALNVIKSKKVR